mmetsp:Transcript_22215/g.21441  ORF Transcript_22215/g.21441 Transcript_22215/m.21441 type:complete len:100 (-) Transcript_22215:1384-1683(-)
MSKIEGNLPPANKRKRPVTPLIKQRDSSELIEGSKDLIGLNEGKKQQPPKRSSSIRRVDREKEEKDKKDRFKAKIAWNVTSPKERNGVITSHRGEENKV